MDERTDGHADYCMAALQGHNKEIDRLYDKFNLKSVLFFNGFFYFFYNTNNKAKNLYIWDTQVVVIHCIHACKFINLNWYSICSEFTRELICLLSIITRNKLL